METHSESKVERGWRLVPTKEARMSLLDALPLDPAPFHVWVAIDRISNEAQGRPQIRTVVDWTVPW